jgi:hypothetical protein
LTLRVGIDLDGVLADFRSAFRTIASSVLHSEFKGRDEELSPSELERVWKTIAGTHNWWVSVGAHEPEQIARLFRLARDKRWEIVFLTKRPPSAGDAVQYQTQWWLEQHGFLLPAVVTVPGSRGELANALRLDILIDDLFVNCAEVVGASTTKALLLLREDEQQAVRDHALTRGIGVVSTLQEAFDVLERLHQILPGRRGRLMRLADWFGSRPPAAPLQPLEPRPSLAIPSSPPSTGIAGAPKSGSKPPDV